jgi:drug/metabolite transporter (DMT)-like permease
MWLILSLLAYILFAGATITDKYLLARPIKDARVYAFYTGIFGLFAFILAPFGFDIPSPITAFFGILAGIIFISALFLFFSALRIGEVSRVGISLGGLVPFFTLIFIYIGTGSGPSPLQFIAFTFLAGGSFIIIFERLTKLIHNLKKLGLVLASSFLFGLYFTLAKFLFDVQSFISAFIFIKIGGALFALLFLFSPSVRRTLFKHKKSLPRKISGIFVAKNIAGGIAALLLHLAVSTARFGEVALVNALQGVQFALVFFVVIFLTKKFPKIIKEEISLQDIIIKATGAGLIIAGVVMLGVA